MADICELDSEMLPYSKKYFEELIQTGKIKEIHPSDVWYEERTAFSEEKPSPGKYRQALEYLKERGVFQNVSGLLVGKPMA